MKRCYSILSLLPAVLAPAVLFPWMVAIAADGGEVSFKDPNLDTLVRKFLPIQTKGDADSKPGTPLKTSQVDSVVLVSGKDVPIRDLAGLQEFKKLEFLYLSNTEVVDLSPLARLTNLEGVTVKGAKIQDLTPLAGLTGLKILDLSENQISDLRPLANLKSLTELNLSDNKITDLSPVTGLTSLESLRVDGNQISDLKPLAGLKSLTLLDVKKNRVTSLAPLASLTGWRYLYLDQNQLTDLAPLLSTTHEDRKPQPGQTFIYRSVSLAGNPLSPEARSKQLPELQKQVFNVTTGTP